MSVVRLLRRCLEKDPKKRLSAIGDARLELDEAADDTACGRLPSAVPPVRPTWRTHLLWGAAGALVAAVGMGAVLASRSRLVETHPVVRSQVAFPGTPLILLT